MHNSTTRFMRVDPKVQSILDEALAGHEISHENALQLLRTDSKSPDTYAVFSAANQLTREQFHGLGEVHAQIGVNYAPCPKRCKFCVFGTIAEKNIEFDAEEVVTRARVFEASGANAIYLMTTGGYDFEKFVDIGKQVKKKLSHQMPLVANIGDFGPSEAQVLAEAGFTAIYHAIRLREGEDTSIDPSERKRTIKSSQDAGLSALFCLEPLGPEHTNEELVDLMFLGKELGVTLHGAMRRVSTDDMPLHHYGETSVLDLAKAVAVCRLVVGNSVLAHCTHEPNLPSLLTGANLLWAETGPNPRDTEVDTSTMRGRGLNVEECRQMLREAGFTPLKGPSRCAQRQT
jgi:biotin synthase